MCLVAHPRCPTNNPNAIDAASVSAVIPINDRLCRTSVASLPVDAVDRSAIPVTPLSAARYARGCKVPAWYAPANVAS